MESRSHPPPKIQGLRNYYPNKYEVNRKFNCLS